MSFKIILSNNFKKEAKRLNKKYRSLKMELGVLGHELSTNPTMGASLGNGVYKIRLAIKSKNKGRSGGARIITYVQLDHEKVLLLSIFDKSEKDNLSDQEIQNLLKEEL
jgi:mRNA-degrading endonuclease RelE of RelBE toxin-antitoxin system